MSLLVEDDPLTCRVCGGRITCMIMTSEETVYQHSESLMNLTHQAQP